MRRAFSSFCIDENQVRQIFILLTSVLVYKAVVLSWVILGDENEEGYSRLLHNIISTFLGVTKIANFVPLTTV